MQEQVHLTYAARPPPSQELTPPSSSASSATSAPQRVDGRAVGVPASSSTACTAAGMLMHGQAVLRRAWRALMRRNAQHAQHAVEREGREQPPAATQASGEADRFPMGALRASITWRASCCACCVRGYAHGRGGEADRLAMGALRASITWRASCCACCVRGYAHGRSGEGGQRMLGCCMPGAPAARVPEQYARVRPGRSDCPGCSGYPCRHGGDYQTL